MTANDEDEDKPDAPPQQVKDLHAVYVDGYFITIWRGHVRLAFGEEVGGDTLYRMACVMPIETVESLMTQLRGLIDRRRARGQEDPIIEEEEEAEKVARLPKLVIVPKNDDGFPRSSSPPAPR
jgi:hypothetical protein